MDTPKIDEVRLDRPITTDDLTPADETREGPTSARSARETTVALRQGRRTQDGSVALMRRAATVHTLEVWLGPEDPEISTGGASAMYCHIDDEGNELRSGAPVLIIDGALAREPTSHVLSHALSLGQRRIEEGAIPIEDVPIVVRPAREHETEEWYKALPRIVKITCTGYDTTGQPWATPNQICMAEKPMDTIELELEIVPEAMHYIDALTLEVQAVVPNRTDTSATPTVAITTDHGWDLESLAEFVEQSRPDWKSHARIVARRALDRPPGYTRNDVRRLPRSVQLLRAVELCARAHRGQRRLRRQGERKGRPYVEHPIEVAVALATDIEESEDIEEIGIDALCIALLHDVIEDTTITADDIETRFGPNIAAGVSALTVPKDMQGADKIRWQCERMSKLTPILRWIKVEDKLANAADIAQTPPEHWDEHKTRKAFEEIAAVVEAAGELPKRMAQRAQRIEPLAQALARRTTRREEDK